MIARILAMGVFLSLVLPACARAESWVLVDQADWGNWLAKLEKPNPWTTPHGNDGVVVISNQDGYTRFSYEPPDGKPFGACQESFDHWLIGVPGAWCDPQILEPTPVEALYTPDVDRFSEKRLKAVWEVRANASASDPLVIRPIMWQWWHVWNFRIFNCERAELHSNVWTTVECEITLPTTLGLVGPAGEDYTGQGMNFAGPYGGTFDLRTLKVYVRD